MGVGGWRRKAKAQEKAQQMQGSCRKSHGARACGRLTKAPHEHGKGLTGCGRFRQALAASLCLDFFVIQKLVLFLSCCSPCLLRSYLHHERNCDVFCGIVGNFA